jgi:hypothetical protein
MLPEAEESLRCQWRQSSLLWSVSPLRSVGAEQVEYLAGIGSNG